MKKTTAQTFIELVCNCPYCNAYIDVLNDVRKSLNDYNSSDNCNVEVTCEECKEIFIVTDVYF